MSNAKILKCFDDNSASELVFFAFRYFLGRCTIATCRFADNLAMAYPLLEKRYQDLIRRELDEAFARDDRERKGKPSYWHGELGHACDRESWDKVRQAYINGNTRT